MLLLLINYIGENMSLKKLIDKRIDHEVSNLEQEFQSLVKEHKDGIGFMFYSLKTILKELSNENIEKGIFDCLYRKERYDFGIDAIYVLIDNDFVDSPNELEEYSKDSKVIFDIYQFKKGTGIDQSSLLKFREGLQKVFIDNDLKIKDNEYLYSYMNNIQELREEIFEKFHSNNIFVRLNICFNGISNNLFKDDLIKEALHKNEELLQEQGYKNTLTKIYGDQELLDKEKETTELTTSLEYKKSFNYITGESNDNKLNGYIAIVNAKVIAELVKSFGNRLFEANIRDYYTNKKDTNNNIYKTAIDEKESKNFWSYNNGLTITCRKVEELPNEKLKLHGLQIVNGCQTSNTLKDTFENGLLKSETFLLVKIIETENEDLIYKITEATNSQTAISIFDLKANEQIHKNIEDYLKEHNIYYERRVNFYKNKKVSPIIDIKKLAQLYLSMILLKPSIARANPKSAIRKEYSNIFPKIENVPEVIAYDLYLVPAMLMNSLEKLISKVRRKKDEKYSTYKIALMANGKFHISCFILSEILKNDYNKKGIIRNTDKIINVLKDENKLLNIFDNALEQFEKLSKKELGSKIEAISAGLRKNDIDEAINKYIQRNK